MARDELLHFVNDRGAVIEEEDLVGAGDEDELRPGDGAGDVLTVGDGDALIGFQMYDECGRRDRRQSMADVVGAVHLEQVSELIVAGRRQLVLARGFVAPARGVLVGDLAPTPLGLVALRPAVEDAAG